MTRLPRPLAVLGAVLTLGLGFTACGDDDKPPATKPAETAEPTAAADAKPTVEKPTGKPPTKLVQRDLVKGKGAAAKDGDQVTVHYVGVHFETGEQFEASWDSGQPYSFTLGLGEVIPGWDKGIAGMSVGGRRELIIPPEDAYGAEGSPPIGPNETLVFVVDVLAIQPG